MSRGIQATPRARTLATTLAVMVLALLGVVAGPAGTASAGEPETIHSLVNQSRAASGLSALSRNGAMDQVAANWANQMAAAGSMSHNPNFSSQIPAGWSTAGENVAYGQPSGAAVHAAWMNSPGHRANILGDYTDIGIAFISAAGTTWSVEVFAKYAVVAAAPAPAPAPPPAPAPAPAPTTPAPAPAAAPAETSTPAAAPAPAAAAPVAAAPLAAPSPERAAAPTVRDARESETTATKDVTVTTETMGDILTHGQDRGTATPALTRASATSAATEAGDAEAGGFVLLALLLGVIATTRAVALRR